MCNGGIECFEHETEGDCTSNGGEWTQTQQCADAIATQGLIMAMQPDMADIWPAYWLGEYGDTCCTGYTPPSAAGSCTDDDAAHYVRACLSR